jgi:TonB family protein
MRLLKIARWSIPLLYAITLWGSGQNVPFAVRITSLEYPVVAAEAQINGTVVLRVRINSNGTVASADARSGHPVLVKAAQQNIKLWKFSAVRPDAPKGELEFNFTYVFELKGVSYDSHPCSALTYEYPDKVTITSKAPHWQP